MSVLTTVRLENTVGGGWRRERGLTDAPLSDQMKYYVFLGMLAEENPDLPLAFIRDLLEGKEEAKVDWQCGMSGVSCVSQKKGRSRGCAFTSSPITSNSTWSVT